MGVQQQLEVIHYETSPTRRNDEVFALNPLGKVPVLICGDDTVLFDSNVICEYLDGLHTGVKLIPVKPAERFDVLKIQALAQGIADAGIAVRWETERRPAALRWPGMRQGQLEKIAAACDFMDREVGGRGAGVNLGDIAVATALSWIEFRGVYDFRHGRPHLARWYEEISARRSMQATALAGETHD
jgi:glutathione S-transferase